jgi:hypothetical protein
MNPSDLDVVLSIGVGVSLGWIVGGFWNLIQGRTWRGFQK